MSYFSKTTPEYWNLDDAIASKKDNNERSTSSALQALRSDLDFFDNPTAVKWKKQWATMTEAYKAPTSPKNPAPTTINNTVNSGTTGSITFQNAFSGNVYSSDTVSQHRPKKTRRTSEQGDTFSPPSKEVEEIDPDSYNREPPPDGIKIDDELIVSKWVSYQVLSAKQIKESSAFIESNTHRILALSNIMLLKKDQNCQDMENIFGSSLIKGLSNYIKSKFNIKRDMLNMDTERKLKNIVMDYYDSKINMREASKCIVTLTSDKGDSTEDNIILGIRNLVERIPKRKFNDAIKERNLCGTYVDAIFRPLFEDPSTDNHFVWADTQVVDQSNKQPDFISRAILNISWCEPVAIGEVKGEDQSNDMFEALLDLIRIGHLSKHSIDNNLYDAVLGIHIVGLQATIYLTCLLDYGLYTMLEICSITMPRDLSNIRSYISSCEDLLPLYDLYKNYCKKSNEPETLKKKITQGISDAVFKKIINTSKNRKRPCPFIVNQ